MAVELWHMEFLSHLHLARGPQGLYTAAEQTLSLVRGNLGKKPQVKQILKKKKIVAPFGFGFFFQFFANTRDNVFRVGATFIVLVTMEQPEMTHAKNHLKHNTASLLPIPQGRS